MPTLNTVSVNNKITLIYGSQGTAGTPITIINLDTQNTVYVGNISNVIPGQAGAFPLAPLASISFDGSVSIYAVTLVAAPISVGVVPGGNSFSPGSLNISGPVTATISGPVTVNGNVGITGTPNVNITNASLAVTGNVGITGTPNVNIANTPSVSISGTPSVTVSGTPNVNVTSGTMNANVTNASINVGGSVSLIPTVANIVTLGTLSGASANVMAPAGTFTCMSLTDVSAYNSISISVYAKSASHTAAGATLTIPLFITWFDDLTSGIPVIQDEIDFWTANNVGVPAGFAGVAYMTLPVRGQYLTITTANPGTASNVTLQFFNAYGSPNIIPRTQCRQQTPAAMGATNGTMFPGFLTSLTGLLGGAASLAMPTATVWFMPMSLFTGQAELFCLTSVAFPHNACLYVAVPGPNSSVLRPDAAGTAVVIDDGISLANTSIADAPIALPKCPTLIAFDNTTGANQSVTCCLTAMDQA